VKTTKKKPVKEAPKESAKETAKEVRHTEALANVDFYRAKLEELRDQINLAVQKKKEEAIPEAEVGDEGDVAMRSLARDLTFEVSDNEHRLLEEVEAALRRIDKGTYGICEANGEKIAVARLKAIPYARYCINCQGRFERA
jgi:DnaK suppressor protein